MTKEDMMEEMVTKANIDAIISLRKSHGDRTALIMTRGLLGAATFMLKTLIGSRSAAAELWAIADQYAVEDMEAR